MWPRVILQAVNYKGILQSCKVPALTPSICSVTIATLETIHEDLLLKCFGDIRKCVAANKTVHTHLHLTMSYMIIVKILSCDISLAL